MADGLRLFDQQERTADLLKKHSVHCVGGHFCERTAFLKRRSSGKNYGLFSIAFLPLMAVGLSQSVGKIFRLFQNGQIAQKANRAFGFV